MNLQERIITALNKIRGYLQEDGGDVEFVSVDEKEKIVYVRLTGTCSGCPNARLTLKAGIETYMREEIPEIVEVRAVTEEV